MFALSVVVFLVVELIECAYVYEHERQIALEYNNRVDDVYFMGALEISFDLQLLTSCPDVAYGYCHIFRIGTEGSQFPRLPLIYVKSSDTQLAFDFSPSAYSAASRSTMVDADFFNGDYHRVYLKYSPLQTLLTVDGTTFVNDTLDTSLIIDGTYLQQSYGVFISDFVSSGGMVGNIKDLTIASWNPMVIENVAGTDGSLVVFFVQDMAIDPSVCGAEVISVELSDNDQYDGVWVSYDQKTYHSGDNGEFKWKLSFYNEGDLFTPPLSLRLTVQIGYTEYTFYACDVITSFTASQQFDLGIDLCDTSGTNATNTCSHYTTTTTATTTTEIIATSISPTTTEIVPTNSTQVFIQNHKDTEAWWVAFYIENLDAMACNIEIEDVQITDHGFYQNQWVGNNAESLVFGDWSFNHLGGAFSLPISVRIEADIDSMNHTFYVCDIITNFTGYQRFPLNIDLCNVSMATSPYNDYEYCNVNVFETTTKTSTVLHQLHLNGAPFDQLLLILMAVIFVVLSLVAYVHAKVKKNDYFQISAFVGVYFQMMDVYTDVLFCVAAGSVYACGSGCVAEEHRIQYLFICIASLACIVCPIFASLYQLYTASSKYWLYQSRACLWLLSFDKLLYVVSIFTGSSFAAISLFNSNLFGSDLFYMGIPKHFMLGFNSKKVYSVILMEDVPQLLLSVWYTALVGHFQSVVAAQMTFTSISLIVTVISLVLKRRIYRVMDSVHIVMSIKGTDVMDKMEVHRNEIEKFKIFLCRSVLGVNKASVEIQKPLVGGHCDGVQLLIFISYIHDESNVNPAKHYEEMIQNAMEKNELQRMMKEQWQLSALPDSKDIAVECFFVESKARQKGEAFLHREIHDDEGHGGATPTTTTTTTTVNDNF